MSRSDAACPNMRVEGQVHKCPISIREQDKVGEMG